MPVEIVTEPSDALVLEEDVRNDLVEQILDAGAESAFGASKLDGRNLSPGCRSCGEGTWSCLFVSGLCNAACFYCPTSQLDKGVPTPRPACFSAISRAARGGDGRVLLVLTGAS